MATNMATHNLGEVVAAAKHLMAHPDAMLEELMRYVPGPDWPGGGIIIGRNGIREAYETGRGTLTTRSMTHFENVTARKKAIVVTELRSWSAPNGAGTHFRRVKNRKLEGISGAIDLTDRHNGTRLVIEIKTGFDPNAVLAQLFRHTPLQDNFTMNNVALVDGRPHTMGLKEMLQVWIDHRRIVVRRRSEFRRRKALERLHLVEGLLLAMIDIDEVIQVIRTSDDADAAKSRLIAVFDLDDVQAQYILDLRLRRLTRMSRIELEAERDDLKRRIEELERILASAQELDRVVVDEMDQAVAEYGTPRRTVLLDEAEDGTLTEIPGTEKLYPADSVIVSISQGPCTTITDSTKNLKTTPRGLFETDEVGRTSIPASLPAAMPSRVRAPSSRPSPTARTWPRPCTSTCRPFPPTSPTSTRMCP